MLDCRRQLLGNAAIAPHWSYETERSRRRWSSRRAGQLGPVASKADEYRRRGQQCLEMAGTFGDRNARVTLAHMAEAWLRLAERDDCIASVATECAQPVVQQQQQVQPKQGQGRAGWAKHGSAMPSHKFHVGETVNPHPLYQSKCVRRDLPSDQATPPRRS
jgi:hypothetical protein